MRVVSLNIDLPDLIVVRRAVDAYLDQCLCQQKPVSDRCDNCQSLQATRDDMDRLASAPKFRPAGPKAIEDCALTAASPLIPLGWEPARPHLRVVSRIEAGG